jgi:hypothetical protein
MAILIYITRAFVLLFCCFSASHRAKTFARWKGIPTHRVIFEVGTGIVGLLVIVEIVYLIVSSSGK